MRRRAHIIVCSWLTACSGAPLETSSTTASTGAASTSDHLSASSTSVGSSVTSTTGASTADSRTTGTCTPSCVDVPPSCPTVVGPDGEPHCSPCDIWAQDCSEGEKCTPWDSDLDGSWDSTICAPVGPDEPGEPCTTEFSDESGFDSCELGAMCWYGTCLGLCDGDPESPTCAEAGTNCYVPQPDILAVCIPACDPIAQDCQVHETCRPISEHALACLPHLQGGIFGYYGDGCSFWWCEPGLACVDAVKVPGCMSDRCCSSFCYLSEPNTCPGAPEQSCAPWYAPGQVPEGLEDLGICAVP